MYAVVQSALYHVTDNDDDDDDDEVKLDPSALIQRLQAAADDDDDHVICLTADHVRINTSMRYSCFISLSLSLSLPLSAVKSTMSWKDSPAPSRGVVDTGYNIMIVTHRTSCSIEYGLVWSIVECLARRNKRKQLSYIRNTLRSRAPSPRH